MALSWLRPLARRLLRRRGVLVIDDFVPDARFGSGAPRLIQLLHALASCGAGVTLWPTSPGFSGVDPDRQALRGIVIADRQDRGLGRFLAANPNAFDAIIVSRPHNMRHFRAAGRASNTSARIVYDAEAIFAEREIIRQAVLGTPLGEAEAKRLLDEELSLTNDVGTVLAVNSRNAETFRQAGHRDVRVLGYAAAPAPPAPAFDRRHGFLFIGPTRGDDGPNGDSVIWFIDHVMPRLRAALGQSVPFNIAGMTGAPAVMQRAGAGIACLGPVNALAGVYAPARVFVAPTRFAAGIPLKVYDAAAHGLPVVLTPLLARQIGWMHEREALVAETPDEFAAACIRLHEDAVLWGRIRAAALERVARDCDPRRFWSAVAGIVE